MTLSLRICSAWQLISELTDFLRSMKVLQGCVRKLLLTLVSFNTNRSVILHSPRENENAEFVMPARIAGIQARRDASGDIRVNLIPAVHAGMTQSSELCLSDRVSGIRR